ncbi:GNAT family N-acetyltransferase [Enemella evansiae]|uniref:GNAT family N-acetyltransferase n=1 Tax=Enemella evansiae TaxID=2016499 RepID=UPI000B975F43|nr:GNAT family protein [Enemella evansiae]OYO01445.1 GNAT family N-acetyltransferase [Enemella evansiae]
MTMRPDHRELVGETVRLTATTPADGPELFAAMDDPRVWEVNPSVAAGRPRDAEEYARELIWDPAVKVQYTIRDLAGGAVVGTTSIMDIDLHNEKAHIGSTMLSPSTWGTRVNPEVKYLLLRHVFEDCGFGRIKIQTDANNERSQAAIAKLGAVREGVIRRDLRRHDGTFRDTVVFSILRSEWPAVREGLRARLAPAAGIRREG